MKILIALVLIQLAIADERCKVDEQDPEAHPAYLKFQLCKVTQMLEKMNKKIDELSKCCDRPAPPTVPPPPPPTTKPRIPDNMPSCQAIKNKAGWVTGNKAYPLMVDGKRFNAYCHFGNLPGCGEGPWTMVMKLDGHKNTFHWRSSYWSNRLSFNPAGGTTGFDSQETKLPTYWGTPFKRICLGMKFGGAVRWMSIDKQASSLFTLIADGRYRRTTVGRNSWRSLISESSLQPHCNKEGFNVQADNPPAAKARIGLIANDHDYSVCRSCDSFIGFGTSYPASGRMDSTSCGNEAIFNADHGTKHAKAFGYILVK